MPPKLKVWLLVAAVAAIALLVFAIIGNSGRFVVHTVDYVVASLVNVSGLSPFLVRGLVILATIPFFWAVAKYTRTIIGFQRLRPSLDLYLNPYGIVIVTYVAGFFLAMYFSSRSTYFGLTTGETLKWCADTIEGIRVFDSPGVDPVYGVKLTPCSGDQIASLRARKVGLTGPKRVEVKDPRVFEFFEGVSGRPKVWYTRTSEGVFELFDGPGKHPTTGQDLRAIDAVVVSEILQLHDANTSRQRQQTVERVEQELKQEAEARDASARANHEATLNRYLNRGASNVSSAAVLIVDGSGRIDQSLTQDIASRVKGSTTLFKPAFVQDGLFGRAARGDTSALGELELGRMAASIVLGTISSTSTSEPVAGENVVKAHTTIVLRVYRTTQGFPSSLLMAAGAGVGFSKALAEQRAVGAAIQDAIKKLDESK
jgi:hypothetical protein